ncbi:hypothetical protein QJS10_CPB04g01233 [Acorus calamus]|uniref:Uncharacterized protein n=1 Tax=Acorus calamus TaxID=4465 RepID=A0AAV9F1K7_ACOCL|nr:hypothetical protein QJS10_CPB04g01233 [Acorus calamus]
MLQYPSLIQSGLPLLLLQPGWGLFPLLSHWWNMRPRSPNSSKLIIQLGNVSGTELSLATLLICVEIEASTILLDDVTVEIPGGGRDQFKVIYEWRPEPCLHCHTSGHYSENCCKKTSSSKPSLTSEQPAIIPLANASNDPPSSTSPSTSNPSPTLNQSASAPTQNGSATLALVDANSTIKVSNVSKSSVGPSNHSCGANASSSVRGVGDAAVITFSGAQVAVGGPSLDTTVSSISVKISGDDSGVVLGMSKPIVTMVDYGGTVVSLTGEDVSLWAEGAASVIHNSSNDEDSFYLLDSSKDMGVKADFVRRQVLPHYTSSPSKFLQNLDVMERSIDQHL